MEIEHRFDLTSSSSNGVLSFGQRVLRVNERFDESWEEVAMLFGVLVPEILPLFGILFEIEELPVVLWDTGHT